MLRAGVVMVAVFACACTTDSADHSSIEYQAGYSDGCATGTARGSRVEQPPVRQEDVYQQSSDYRAGWASGYHTCGASANPGRS